MAAYCADKLPDLVKDTEAYKEGNMEKALVDAFLGLDATIATSEVVDKLKKIAMAKKGKLQLFLAYVLYETLCGVLLDQHWVLCRALPIIV